MASNYEHGRITEEALAALRAKIGQEVRVSIPPYLTEATSDAIRHWCEAIGDRNPLHCDPEYGKRTRWGTQTAPPSILYAFDRLSIGYRGGLPGVHSVFGGDDWEWFKPVRLGDRIKARVVFKDLVERPSSFAGRHIQQISEITWINQDGEIVARSWPWGFRIERNEAAARGKYRQLEPAHYTKDDLERIIAAYEREEIRGSAPRYWEEVQIGELLPPIVRGPYTLTNVIAFEQAWGGLFILTHGRWYEMLKRHTKLGIPNAYGVPEPPEAVHWDRDFARSVGLPAPYDYGPERVAWIINLLTNWMGDDGFLRRLHVEIRRFNLIGDTTWCHGRVVGKRTGNGEHLVEIEVWAQDQRGEVTARGHASVRLPSKTAMP